MQGYIHIVTGLVQQNWIKDGFEIPSGSTSFLSVMFYHWALPIHLFKEVCACVIAVFKPFELGNDKVMDQSFPGCFAGDCPVKTRCILHCVQEWNPETGTTNWKRDRDAIGRSWQSLGKHSLLDHLFTQELFGISFLNSTSLKFALTSKTLLGIFLIILL